MAEPGADEAQILTQLQLKGRDNARTPMQWDASPHAGFTTGAPWIKVVPNYTEINVAAELEDHDSIFCYYQQLLALRKTHPEFVYGTYDLLLPDDPDLYVYTRTMDDCRLLTILNFGANTPAFVLPAEVSYSQAELLISNYAVLADEPGPQRIDLRPYEARVYRLL
jgi:oligo-1,6-glucosidase